MTTELLALLEHHHAVLLIVHLIGFALGAGAAFTTDAVFFRALLDPADGGWHPAVIATTSALIWLALALVTVSGVGLFLPEGDRLLGSPKFLVKMQVVLVIVVNGVVFERHLKPYLATLFLSSSNARGPHWRRFRRFAASSGAVSAASWLSAIVLGGLGRSPLGFPALLGTFAGVVAAAVAVGLLAEAFFASRLARASRETTGGVAERLLDDLDTYNTLFSRPRR